MRKYRRFGILVIMSIVLILQVADSRAEEASCKADEYKVMSLLIQEQYDKEFELIPVSYTHLRAHDTMTGISYTVFC